MTFRVALALALALGVLLRVPTFLTPILSDDEAIYAATATAMDNGAALYRDVVDHKPPGIYYIYRLGFRLWGDGFSPQGAHLLVVLATVLTGLLLAAALLRSTASSTAALMGALLWSVCSTTWHDYDALAANCELFLVPLHCAVVWMLLHGPLRPQRAFGMGVLVGCSALLKYQGLTMLGVVGVAALGQIWFAKEKLSRRLLAFLALVVATTLGAALPIGAYLLMATQNGSRSAAMYWFLYNFHYVGGGLSGMQALVRGLSRTALIGVIAWPAYAVGLWAAGKQTASIVRALRTPGPPVTVPLIGVSWLLTEFVAVRAGGRFFGHYFHLILPPLVFLAAPLLAQAFARGRFRALLVLGLTVPAVIFFSLATSLRSWKLSRDEAEAPYATVAKRIEALSDPRDQLFVWGNSPQLYVASRRVMGTRFSFCNYMTGENPGLPESNLRDALADADRNTWVPSWDMLLSDLEQRGPRILVDASAGNFDGYGRYRIARYPRLARYLTGHYSQIEQVSGVRIYLRRY